MTSERPPLIPLGAKTNFGEVQAIASFSGERYYFCWDGEIVSMMPATEVRVLDGPSTTR